MLLLGVKLTILSFLYHCARDVLAALLALYWNSNITNTTSVCEGGTAVFDWNYQPGLSDQIFGGVELSFKNASGTLLQTKPDRKWSGPTFLLSYIRSLLYPVNRI
jgi:hypothetical protein